MGWRVRGIQAGRTPGPGSYLPGGKREQGAEGAGGGLRINWSKAEGCSDEAGKADRGPTQRAS